MTKHLLIGLSALTLVACEDGSNAYMIEPPQGFAEADFAPAPQSVVVQEARTKVVNGREVVNDDSADPAGVFLAYRYGYGLVMPSASVKPTADKHMQICRDAGTSKCQIIGSNTNNYSEEDIRANLSLRAEPEWLQTFVTGMKADIAEIDGRIESENTSVEDLTRAILDTDARLKAQTTLRTRLENLLATRDAKLPDLLALERELARVQAEIESATANLKALRARVSMSVVNLSYTSERVAVSRSSVSPIGEALKDFVGIVSEGLAGVIRFLAALLPWMIFIIIPGLFLSRWFWRRRKKTKLT
ncbi:MAG: DUF4349 domain-containing protein [Litorimonas sp.]